MSYHDNPNPSPLPRKHYTGTWALLGVLALLIIGGLLIYANRDNASTAGKTDRVTTGTGLNAPSVTRQSNTDATVPAGQKPTTTQPAKQ